MPPQGADTLALAGATECAAWRGRRLCFCPDPRRPQESPCARVELLWGEDPRMPGTATRPGPLSVPCGPLQPCGLFWALPAAQPGVRALHSYTSGPPGVSGPHPTPAALEPLGVAWGAAHFPGGVPRVATSTSDPTAQPSQLLGSFALGSEEVDSGLRSQETTTPQGRPPPAGLFHGRSPWAIPAGPRVVSFLTTAPSSRCSQEAGEAAAEGRPPSPLRHRCQSLLSRGSLEVGRGRGKGKWRGQGFSSPLPS